MEDSDLFFNGVYVKDLKFGTVHKIEIGVCEEYSKKGMIKIFSENMSHSYWVESSNYERAELEDIYLKYFIEE